jgi:hypothetical protein
MTFLAKPTMAVGFGLFFLCAVACTHFEEITSRPLSLIPDWTAGTLLIGMGVINRRDRSAGRTYQIAAWAFMLSLLFASSLGSLEEWLAPASAQGVESIVSLSLGGYLLAKGVLCFIALGALLSSLRMQNAVSRSLSTSNR